MPRAHPQGSILYLRVQPGARREGVVGRHGGRLKVAVRAAPEKGKANEAIVDLLAGLLGVRRQEVELLQGETNRDKAVLVRGLSPTEAAQRLGLKD